jgi:hypothetical protein
VGEAIYDGAYGARIVWGGGGRETVNRKRKLSAVFVQPIQNPSYRLLQEGVGWKLSAVFYNRYKIVVYTGPRSDSIKNHASRNEARRIAAMRIIFTRISCTLFTCHMYTCRLRRINDPVLSSLKMEGIRLLFKLTEGLGLTEAGVKVFEDVGCKKRRAASTGQGIIANS